MKSGILYFVVVVIALVVTSVQASGTELASIYEFTAPYMQSIEKLAPAIIAFLLCFIAMLFGGKKKNNK